MIWLVVSLAALFLLMLLLACIWPVLCGGYIEHRIGRENIEAALRDEDGKQP